MFPLRCLCVQAPDTGFPVQVNFDPKQRPSLRLLPSKRDALLKQEQDLQRSGKTFRYSDQETRLIRPPSHINNTLNKIVKNDQLLSGLLEQYLAAGIKFRRFLNGRHPPQEKSVTNQKLTDLKLKLEKEFEDELSGVVSKPRMEEIAHEIKTKAESILKKTSYNWKPVAYDEAASWAYLLAKAPYDYACSYRVLKEIKDREEPDFQPRTLFDFGSGVGTNIWAARSIFGHFTEIFAVDTSSEMNELAKLILLEGKGSHSLPAGIFFRMHLPASNDLTYDIVTSSFTLLELPSANARLSVADTLWRKTNGYLIFIEEGTNAGFQVLSEIRDYLIQISRMKFEDPSKVAQVKGHLFAPCPHSLSCPRYFNDTIPCNFDVMYQGFKLDKLPNIVNNLSQKDRFSYLVFKKGDKSETSELPRLVAEPSRRHNHVICRMCTRRGKLEEFVSTKKAHIPDSRLLYRHLKGSHCGEQLSVEFSKEEP